MKILAFSFVVSLAYAGSANAWFFQPVPSEIVPEATVQQFSSASSTALEAISLVYNTLAEAEQNEAALNEFEQLTNARDLLDSAAEQFANLPTEQLAQVAISRDALASVDEAALDLFESSGLSSLEAVARFAGEKCSEISDAVQQLLESGFGPDTSGDIPSRVAINEVSDAIFKFTFILNTASGALAQTA